MILPSGSTALRWKRHPDDFKKIAVLCGLLKEFGLKCGKENFFSKNSVDRPTLKTGLCRTHEHAEITLHFARTLNLIGSGQKEEVAEKRGRGRVPIPPEVKEVERERRKAEFESKVCKLGKKYESGDITRSLICGEYMNAAGQCPEDSTITKWVGEFYGKGTTVKAAIRLILKSRINTA